MPWYAYDTLTLSGTVTEIDDGVLTLDVVGTNSLGDHITSKVTLTVQGAAA